MFKVPVGNYRSGGIEMLCFVFSILVVVLDQLFKRWAVIALSGGTDIKLIPGVIGLTYIENTGAFWGMLSNFRFVLIAVSLLCSAILIFILLRYDGGFWGRLGLAAALGGAVGNLIDRVFRTGGAVIDMFEFEFVRFAIFNVADIFITLGGITFVVCYIVASIKADRAESKKEQPVTNKPQTPRVLPKPETQQAQGFAANPTPAQKNMQLEDPPPFRKLEPQKPAKSGLDEYEEYLKGLSSSNILEEFDLDQIMSEYGINDDKD